MKKADTALIIMAAGIGSRFGGGGLKQLSTIDPYGNIIMDYSVYDAVAAGFNQIVFVVRKDTFEQFKEVIGNRIEKSLSGMDVKVSYVFQEISDLPNGYQLPQGRTKPWGTGQAVLACKDVVHCPYLIINADDYYGKDCYVKMHRWLVRNDFRDRTRREDHPYCMAMAGFVLKNTVSENGTVTRGICQGTVSGLNSMAGSDAQTSSTHRVHYGAERNMLTQIIETKGIRIEDGKVFCNDKKVQQFITPDTTVSMNMWAGYPDFIEGLEEGFQKFLRDGSGDPLTKEYLIPVIVEELLKADRAEVEILETDDQWIGITYKEDLPIAREQFATMIEAGEYPEGLWRPDTNE